MIDLRRSSSLGDHAAAAAVSPVTALISMMIVVVLPLPRRPAVMVKHGRSVSRMRSIRVSASAISVAFPVKVGGDVDQPLVAQELHGRLHRAPRCNPPAAG